MAVETARGATTVWLLLVALTVSTWLIGESGSGGTGVMAVVLGTAFVKGQLVADWFMGLRRAGALWRGLVLGYLLLVCALIAIAYAMGME